MNETFLTNLLLKAILIPLSLAFASVALELVSALVKGKSNGPNKFRVWVEQAASGNIARKIVPVLNQSLHDIRTRSDILDVDTMVSFDLANLGSVAINLFIAAFTVDITVLIDETSQPRAVGFVLLGHLILLIGIVVFLMLSEHANPEEISFKRRMVALAIILGLLATIIALFAS